MEYKKFTVVVIAALVASLIFAGTILAPIQSYAAGSRAQHMNQGNLCYRSNTCRQSEVGQNTLGNDNQVTGFGDQRDNTNNNTSTANGGAQGSPGAAGEK